MALFDGLLGGGTADPYDLYGDILTAKQREALRARSSDQTWANAANFLAKAAMPTNRKIPLGGLLAGLAGSMGGGNQDEAVNTALKGSLTTSQIAKLRREQKFLDELSPYLSEAIKRQFGGGGGGVPAAPGAPSPPPGAPGAPTPGGFPPPPAAVPLDADLLPYAKGPPAQPGGGDFPGIAGPGASAGSAALNPANLQGLLALAGSGGGMDTGIWSQLASMYGGGGGGSGTPFDLASLGQGQGLPDLGPVQVEALSGKAAPAGGVEMPFPTLQNPNKPRDAWAQGVTYDQPKVPFGQAPEDRVRPESGSGSSYGASRADTVAYWRSRGMPQHVAEGIADRVGVESSYRSDAMGDRGTSGGLYQHHADRLARLKSFAASEGKPWTDPDVQHRFAGTETQGGDPQATRAMPAIANAPDRQTAAKLWDRHFERSAAGPGSRLPNVGRVNIEPLGGEAAPAGGQSGLVPGLGVTPEALALMNAMAKLGGIDSPFGSLLETYYKSPGYLREKAVTEKEVGLEYDPKIEAAKAAATQKYIQENATHESGLKLANDLIGKGVYFNKETKRMEPITNAAQALAEIDRVKEQNKVDLQLIDTTLTFPGETEPRTVQMTGAQARAIAEGREVQVGGVKIPAMTGIKLGKPVLSPGETTRQQKSAEAPYTTKDVELTWPDGETRKVTVTGEQAKDIAEGKPVPVIGWPGSVGGGAASSPVDSGPRGGATVYPPGHAEATTVLLKERRPKAEAAVQSLQFNDVAKQLLDAGIISGTGAGLRLDAAKAASLFGWDSEKIAATESFLATQARQVASVLGSGAFGSGASITDEDRRQVASMVGANANLDEKSLRFLVRLNETAANWEIDRYSKDVDKHDPKNRLPILRVDRPPKAETKPPVDKMSNEAAQARAAAAAAIAKGAPKDAVLKRLRDAGIDIGGL